MTLFSWNCGKATLIAFIVISFVAAVGGPLALWKLEAMFARMEREHMETAQKLTAAITALQTGQITPSGPEVVRVLTTSLRADEAAQNVASNLWGMNKKAVRVVVWLSITNIVLCVALLRARMRTRIDGKAL